MNELSEEDKAREIHERAIVFDGHSDILIPIAEGKMSLNERIEIPDAVSWIAPPVLERYPLVNFGAMPRTVYFGCMG